MSHASEASSVCTDYVHTGVAQSLPSLPNSILTSIMESVVRCSNPGQVIKLALVCRALLRAVSEAEGFWEQLSVSHGWSHTTGPRAALAGAFLPPGSSFQAPSTVLSGPSGLSDSAHLNQRWFHCYIRRMACRRSVRRFMALYSRFLSRPSSMALMPGADPGALSAWEQRMGVQLPSELWELYRYRNGQAPGAFVTFADDMRLLGLEEVLLERHPGLSELRHRLARMGRSQAHEPTWPWKSGGSGGSGGGGRCDICSSHGEVDRRGPSSGDMPLVTAGSGTTSDGAVQMMYPCGSSTTGAANSSSSAAGGGPGESCTDRSSVTGDVHADTYQGAVDLDGLHGHVLVVARNSTSSRRFLVALDGQVYLARGILSLAFFAPSVGAMLQKLLH